ncbi:ADP-ribosylglycohydrolase family protein [Alienimonas californiensis]|uniref:ADP-ribosyl-[dinitrogen reductase] glycohydrolase n=1 Tax=Alienimonas californiensis TaxID=2527989 RepID=A0A517P753_9PLAN|nr:ADP-ribosylglycohydrolase family protein [Alienimonas californiensis]QDT15211.1 ADP-ribosyl-[dinitrogen reductase] glycohydrolase [Alienimonas californiensis]
MNEPTRADRLAGCLLGTAVGDALGLPRENLSPRRAAKLFPGPVRHGLVPAVRSVGGSRWRGMVSDDTEHTLLSALALIEEPADPARSARALARRLKWWLAGGPAGAGKATLKACGKLCCGVPPSCSGVNSAGNGPTMRAAILGAFFADDPDRRRAFAEVSARITHTDPRAVAGAQTIAHAAALAVCPSPRQSPAATLAALIEETTEPALQIVLETVAAALARGEDGRALAEASGWPRGGPSGFVLHTVPAALWAWLAGEPAETADDVRGGIERALSLGGDADSTAAIVGGLAGCAGGTAAIPADWREGLWEWPRGAEWMRRCAAELASAADASAERRAAALGELRVPPGAVPARNAAFLVVVLAHALRRLGPPW